MRRGLRILAIALGTLALLAGALAWRWTHTPYGTMDLGAALVVHSLPGGPPVMTPEARAQANAWIGRFLPAVDPSVSIRDESFEGPGGPQPLRIYTPPGDGPFPVVLWIHGGGFWMGEDLPIWDGPNSQLAATSQALVVSVGYRLAPEAPFPAAIDDCWAALLAVAARAPEWKGDPQRLAVMGGSAGGNLAAAVALRARDAGGPAIAFQALVVPALQAGGEPSASRRNFASGYGLDGLGAMTDAYAPDPRDHGNPWLSPLLASSLAGLPPALILTAEFDPLRDEGEAYAERLRAAGVAVTLERYAGAIHGFLGSPDDMEASGALISSTLREALAAESG
jgi:acetyl esterase